MFSLQESHIDVTKIKKSHTDPRDGALVAFEGIVRSDMKACPPKLNAQAIQQRRVSALMYVADAVACRNEGEKIINEVFSKFPVSHAVCIQRTGKVNVGETAVWIGVWAGHRDEAFKACRYIIEEIKKRLLMWKKEHYADGSSAWIHGNPTTVEL